MEIEKPQFEVSKPEIAKKLPLKETNQIQIDLIENSGQKPADWIRQNSAAFREILESRPELLELYCQDPEAAKKLIADALWQKQPYH